MTRPRVRHLFVDVVLVPGDVTREARLLAVLVGLVVLLAVGEQTVPGRIVVLPYFIGIVVLALPFLRHGSSRLGGVEEAMDVPTHDGRARIGDDAQRRGFSD